MKPPADSTASQSFIIADIRAEIEKRKGDLTAAEKAASAPCSSPAKPSASALKKATIALDRVKKRIQNAKKWPAFLRFVACNHYAVTIALLDAIRNIGGETGRLQKALATLEGNHNDLSRKHSTLLDDLEEERLAGEPVRGDIGDRNTLFDTLESKYQDMAKRHDMLVGQNLALSSRLIYLEGSVHSMERHYAGAFESMVKNLALSAQTGPGSAVASDSSLASELDTARLDEFYLGFENQFRGSRELIKERLQQYIPILDALKTRIPDATAVDIGCGRGEWLEVLGEQGIAASGVDMNSRMVATCKSLGLDAECRDGIAFLKNVPDKSLAMVSGFHIVEHLAAGPLLELFQQIHRVLLPGGIAIFETPNPEVPKVSTYTFFFDPTHRNPIPPELLSFIGTNCGFSEARVERFQPLVEDGKILGYLDYACICTK